MGIECMLKRSDSGLSGQTRIAADRQTSKSAHVDMYNCAKVYLGQYSYGYISFMPQDDTYRSAKSGYELLNGEVSVKRLLPVRVRGAQDSEGDDKYHVLQTVVVYPKTPEAIIRVFSARGKRTIKLIRREAGQRSTMFRARL